MEDEIAYMKDHPPCCLGGHIKPVPDSLRNYLLEQLGENSTVFCPVCSCGNEFVTISSAEGFSPATIDCPRCGQSRLVFDPTRHGYDGALGHYADPKMAAQTIIPCSHCGNETQQIAMCFQYSGETDVLEDADPPDVKPEDLFGWIMIAGQCESCGTIQEVSQTECA